MLLNGKNKMYDKSKDIPFNNQIAYLENFDFDNDGKIMNKELIKQKIILIMVKKSSCGYCTEAKPSFQEYANKTKRTKVFCATIHVDGERDSERELGERIIDVIPRAIKGFPCYALYINGNLINKEMTGDRGVKSLGEFTGVKAQE